MSTSCADKKNLRAAAEQGIANRTWRRRANKLCQRGNNLFQQPKHRVKCFSDIKKSCGYFVARCFCHPLRPESEDVKKMRGKSNKELKQLETELRQKHALELAKLTQVTAEQEQEQLPEETQQQQQQQQQPKKQSRQQRKRNEKREQEKQRQREAEELRKNVVSKKQQETTALLTKLTANNLKLKEIVADGNCLYNALVDQMNILYKTPLSVQQLRTETAAYMLTHSDDFKPFVDLEEDTHESFEAYCEAIKSTSSWGGQLELKALTHYLKVPILIHSAYSPDIVMGEEYEGSPLHLSFHQHYYTLGEHYNSVVPSD